MLNERTPSLLKMPEKKLVQADVVDALRAHGCTVLALDYQQCYGLLLVGFKGLNYVLRVMDRPISEDEKSLHVNWQGDDIRIVTSSAEAIAAVSLFAD